MKNLTGAQWPSRVDLPHLLDNLPLFINSLGFHFWAFTFISPNRRESTSNFPTRWLEHYKQHGYAALDPVVVHCRTSSLPLMWDATIFSSAPEIWAQAQACGLRHGWVQPTHSQHTHSSLSVLRSNDSISSNEYYEKAAQVMWLGELLHRARLQQC